MDGKPHLCGLIHTYSQTVKQNNTYIVYNRNYRKYRVFMKGVYVRILPRM